MWLRLDFVNQGVASKLKKSFDVEKITKKFYDRFKFEDILKQVARHYSRQYFILKSIIINNLYGVDIMHEAIEICKLRFFLKLVAQVEYSKPIIDEIDHALAKHYGFTDEELDFIINYEIKYRMGQDNGNESESEE